MSVKNLDDLKLLIVIPAIRKARGFFDRIVTKATLWKPITAYQIASLSKRCKIKIIDENYEKIKYSSNFDLVAISAFTATAFRAYEIADEFMKRGVKVVLGGYHPSALPLEAKQHADAVVIGNAESIWNKVLENAAKDDLKPFYFSPPLKSIASPAARKGFMVGIEATRGCPYRCKFCSISNSHIGCNYVKKPIDRVIKEIKMAGKYFIFYDSSLTIDMKYTKELFRRLIHLNKKFACFGNINMLAADEELLRLASEAGCVAWAVGMETFSQDALTEVGKKNDLRKYKRAVSLVKDYGMNVIASLVFGFDNDDASVFSNTLERLYELGVDSIGVNILTPFPGTPLFEKLNNEHRILTYDWEKYDLYHVVYMPKRMSPWELLDGTKWIAEKFFSYRNIFDKFFKKSGIISKFSLLYHMIGSRLVYSGAFETSLKNIKMDFQYKLQID